MATRIRCKIAGMMGLSILVVGCPQLENQAPVEILDDIVAPSIGSGSVASIGIGMEPIETPVGRCVIWTDSANQSQEYKLLAGAGSSAYVRPNGVPVLDGGWMFLSGRWPYARTRRAVGGAEGSEMIVSIDPTSGGDIERYFFTNGDTAFLWQADPNDPASIPIEWTDFDIFYEVPVVGSPILRRLSEDEDAQEFVDFVLDRAESAGLREE